MTTMTKTKIRFDISAVLLPAAGALLLLALWAATSGTVSKNLPSPAKTWEVSRPFVVAPFEKRGELDQGVARFAWYSLILVAKGYAIALLLGAPLGFILGWSKLFAKSFDPIIQVLRPVSPLAWLPLGLVLFQKSHPAALFTIAVCSMWPTVLNTALGVRNIPKEYLNVARVLQLGPWKRVTKIIIPSALPLIFTGLRISLSVGWMVLIAAEMLSQNPGLGKFVWDMFQNGSSKTLAMIVFAVFTIGIVGFALDRLMVALQRMVSYDLALAN